MIHIWNILIQCNVFAYRTIGVFIKSVTKIVMDRNINLLVLGTEVRVSIFGNPPTATVPITLTGVSLGIFVIGVGRA